MAVKDENVGISDGLGLCQENPKFSNWPGPIPIRGMYLCTAVATPMIIPLHCSTILTLAS